MGKQIFETRNLPLQGEDGLFELRHFQARPTLSKFCHLGLFLVIEGVS